LLFAVNYSEHKGLTASLFKLHNILQPDIIEKLFSLEMKDLTAIKKRPDRLQRKFFCNKTSVAYLLNKLKIYD